MTTAPLATIIGVGPGLGLALARALGHHGYRLALVARSASRLEDMAQDLRGEGLTATVCAADAASEPELRAAMRRIRSECGPTDVLVNNISLFIPGTPSTVDTERTVVGLQAGAVSALISLQEVVPDLRARGHGRLLFTGGGTALKPWTEAVALSMQKAALRNLALAAADELAPEGIVATLVTITGVIGSPGLEPETIASQYVALLDDPNPPTELVISADTTGSTPTTP